jgi:CheY-like chemotaxis protein
LFFHRSRHHGPPLGADAYTNSGNPPIAHNPLTLYKGGLDRGDDALRGARVTATTRRMTNCSSRLRAYLVEDSSIMTDLLTGLLTNDGVLVIGNALDASTAVTEIKALRPDVVILDIALREGNGFDVLKATRTPDADGPAFIMLTNYTMEAYRKVARTLGVVDFFDKSSEILRALDSVKAIAKFRGKNNGSTG